MSSLFWLTDAQMARPKPLFPKGHGKLRVDAPWNRSITGAPRPRTPSKPQYSDHKLHPRS